MAFNISRRRFLNATAMAAGAAGLALPWGREARAQKVQLIGVMWGGPWLEGAKAATALQTKYDIKWELHTGGSAAIQPKIKAAWPNPPYDFVTQFSPQFITWEREGWPEPVTKEEMPNLKDIPDDLIYKGKNGQILAIPLSVSAVFFAYRKDLVPFPIKKMEDLLDPRLKGKLNLRDATQGQNNNMVHYAIANGGSVDNLEPGWEFLKKLAKTGNIGRFAKTEVDFINSLTSGETVAGFSNIGNWGKVAEKFPVEFLIRDKKEAPGFQAGLLVEGFCILKTSKHKKEVKEFINHFIGAEASTVYNKPMNMAPPNSKSQSTDLAKKIVFPTKADLDKFSIRYNWELLSQQGTASIERFEKEIVPLTR
jgi:putative spermidine/putrescine transport system substrate-binding protein